MDSLQISQQPIQNIPDFQMPALYSNDIWNIKKWDYYIKSTPKAKDEFCSKVFSNTDDINWTLCSNPYIREEIKYYCYLLIEKRKVNLYSFATYFSHIKALIRYSNEFLSSYTSLSNADKDDYIDFICNKDIRKKAATICAGTRIRAYDMKEHKETLQSKYIKIFDNIINAVNDFFDDRTLFDKDVWILKDLPFNLEINENNPIRSVSFNVKQSLMKATLKKYTWMRFNSISISSIKLDITNISIFCKWLAENHSSMDSFAELNRIIIEEYISFLRTKAGISSQLLAKRLGSLSTFLDFCKIRKIPNTPLITLIDSNDYCTKVQYEQQPYSDNEMKQIMANINKLKNQQLARMVFCLSEIACRPSEFCSLRPADLIKDKDDKYSLTINANKNKNIYTVPVSNMVALILEAAITESKEQYGEDVKYIFAASHDDFIRTTSLDYYLKQLSVENNIIDDAGNILHITFHRFRTTRASKYLQQGMDADVISLLLGHKVKNTLKHYAKASNKEILNALKPLMDKYEQMINNIGNMSAMKDLSTNTIPLPNGRCSKAVATGICDHANHCLSCSMFIPKPEFLLGYKRQLAEVEAAINLATESDAPRLLEYNTMLKKQLENIIKQCEEDENEKV